MSMMSPGETTCPFIPLSCAIHGENSSSLPQILHTVDQNLVIILTLASDLATHSAASAQGILITQMVADGFRYRAQSKYDVKPAP